MDAAAFLDGFGDDHVLCSIDPADGRIWCQRDNTEVVVRWARAQNASGRNIYYHFNQVRAGVMSKASKDDITHIRGLPDDLDWGWKHHSGCYPDRLHELVTQQQQLQNSATPPSMSVFTGGGFQNLYLFPAPLPATPDTVRRLEALSRSLVAERGSDMVGNPDRLLRLPGFTNYPHQKKTAAGQPQIIASLLPSGGRTYSLEELLVSRSEPRRTRCWGKDSI
jgi:hypothetical protein